MNSNGFVLSSAILAEEVEHIFTDEGWGFHALNTEEQTWAEVPHPREAL